MIPNAAETFTMRRTRVDLPNPGRPSTNAEGFRMRRDRNHMIGSPHTVAPVSWCLPNGTPSVGVPEPAENGHNPHTCTVVPRYSGGASTHGTCPPPARRHPRTPGRAARACRATA